jgi:4-amino-4-deoxy-L-arabinose transferase-like glycosyltransferase
VILAGLVLEAVVLFGVLPRLGGRLRPHYGVGFADDYDKLARSLVNGEGYRFYPDTAPTLMREPGYPVFLATVFSLLGSSIVAARVGNLVLAGLIACLLPRLALRVTSSRWVVLIATFLFLVHPGTIVAQARASFETLFALLLLVLALALGHALDRGGDRSFLLAGVCLGLVDLVRSTFLLFPAVVVALLIVAGPASKSVILPALRKGSLMTIASIVVLSPWIVRNRALTGKWVFATTVQGTAAHAGQYICTNLSLSNGFQELDAASAAARTQLAISLGYSFRRGFFPHFYRTSDEIEFNEHLLARVRGQYLSHPLLAGRCTALNLLHFWFAGKTWPVTGLNVVLQLPLLVLAVIGLRVVKRERGWNSVAPALLPVLYLPLLHAPVLAQARYSVPLIPLLVVYACIGLLQLSRLAIVERMLGPAVSRLLAIRLPSREP